MQKPHVFSDLASEVTLHHFSHILLDTQTNPETLWNGATQGHTFQKVEIIGAILHAGCHA